MFKWFKKCNCSYPPNFTDAVRRALKEIAEQDAEAAKRVGIVVEGDTVSSASSK